MVQPFDVPHPVNFASRSCPASPNSMKLPLAGAIVITLTPDEIGV
jgi:hypothetical protein